MLKTITAVLATILFVMNAFIRLVDRMKERDLLHEEISVFEAEDGVDVFVKPSAPITFTIAILRGFRPRIVFLRKSFENVSSFRITSKRLTSSRNLRISFLVQSRNKRSLITLPVTTVNKPK